MTKEIEIPGIILKVAGKTYYWQVWYVIHYLNWYFYAVC
jgi:hypothetical protein